MAEYYMIEKFTRCPHCGSFSLKGVDQGKTNIFVCSNCGNHYVLKGDTLKKTTSGRVMHQKKQETEMNNAKEGTKEKTPVRPERKTIKPRKPAVFLIPVLFLVIIGVIFLLSSRTKDREQIETPQPQVEKAENTKKDNPESKADEEPPTAAEEAQTQELPKDSDGIESGSLKIFDASLLKVRSSSPDSSTESMRWNFKRKKITVKRSKTQQVYIAGDSSGENNWAVDDEIIINGNRIKGFTKEMTEIGVIPRSSRVPPYDITHLVPPDKETILDIMLVDYGIVWGNTSLYIVIK